ncbi:hypothetical protein Tco_1118345 [Tanacetum coccineum]
MGSIPQGPAPAKIVKWQIIKTGKRGAYQIIREDNTDVVYVNFQGLLNDLTRYDLKELYRLMMLKDGDNRPEEEFYGGIWRLCLIHHLKRIIFGSCHINNRYSIGDTFIAAMFIV